MSDLDSSAIRARCEAATAAPWEVQTRYPGGAVKLVRSTAGPEVTGPVRNAADLEFIAHSRQDVLTLLDVNDRLLAEIERLNAQAAKDLHALAVVLRLTYEFGDGQDPVLTDRVADQMRLEIHRRGAPGPVRAALATEVKPNE